jgi:DnaJ-class molecular chaperone
VSRDFLSGYKTYNVEEEGFGNKWTWKRNFHRRMSKEEATAILDEDDPYVILGVNRSSSKTVIKKAFYALALLWHPDRNPNRIELSTLMMQKINAAYTIISEFWR